MLRIVFFLSDTVTYYISTYNEKKNMYYFKTFDDFFYHPLKKKYIHQNCICIYFENLFLALISQLK